MRWTTQKEEGAMKADLLVELPGHRPCLVAKTEFIPMLRAKGWHQIGPDTWASPQGNEPEAAFADVSRSLTPRRGDLSGGEDRELRPGLPVFRRHHRRGVDVWVLH
jgi:hypothetical protein